MNTKFTPYVDRMPTQIRTARDLVEISLQSITVPSYQYDAVSQGGVDTMNHNEITTNLRGTFNAQDLTQKSLTLTFKLLNGYINYWVLLDTWFYHYDMENPNADFGDISLNTLDNEGNIMFTRTFKKCLFTGISDFELSYSDNTQTFDTFTIDVQYTLAETSFANPSSQVEFVEKIY